MHYVRPIILLTLVYLGFTANLELLNIIAGFIVASLVVLLIQPHPRKVNWRQLPRALFALVRYVLVLVYDLIVSGIQVARIVLNPSLPIKPGIIAINTSCRSEDAAALNAHSITLTPGELVVEMSEDGVMYTHCLDASKSEEVVKDAQKLRVELLEKIFD